VELDRYRHKQLLAFDADAASDRDIESLIAPQAIDGTVMRGGIARASRNSGSNDRLIR